MINNVVIEDKLKNRILTAIGYPVISLTDFGNEFTDEVFKDLVLVPSLELYYTYYPDIIPYQENVSSGSKFEINFPNEKVYNAINVRLNTVTTTNSSNLTGNAFVDNSNLLNNKGYGNLRKYGTRNSYGFETANYTEYQKNLYQANQVKDVNYDIDIKEKIITGYSTINGILSIDFVAFNNDFSYIPHIHLQEVIELCQAELQILLGNLYSLQESDLPNQLDGDELLDKGNTKKEEILDVWREAGKGILRRN